MYRNIKLVPLVEPISAEELIGDQLGGGSVATETVES
jgi:hypothetical protein